MTHTRRDFLTDLTILGGAALLPTGLFAAQGRGGQFGRPRRVDVHHHFAPPTWQDAMSRAGFGNVRGDWTPEKSLAEMDKSGTDTAMVSTGQFIWRLGNEARQKMLVSGSREANEFGASLVQKYPGRFGLWAALPLPEIEPTLKEIAYALDVLKADGFGITTSWGTKYLGDPMFTPVLEELNRRNAVVYSHPGEPACCLNLIPGLPPNPIEYGTDTTRMAMSLVVNKVPTRFPNIKFILSHAGGTTPFLIGRFDARGAQNLDSPAPQGSTLWALRTFYYDTAAAFNPAAMYATKRVMGVDRILFGTDYPYGEGNSIVRGLTNSKIFDEAELDMIYRGNVMKLVPRLARA
jgi:predicted TIM-barrel fold metal-dependent hydrolase